MSTSTRIPESESGYVNDFDDGGSHGLHTRRALSVFSFLARPSFTFPRRSPTFFSRFQCENRLRNKYNVL
jgi:hypothetical protein